MKFLNQIALLALLIATASLNCAAAIKTGSAHIKIDYSSQSDQTADDLTATIIYSTLFDNPLATNELILDRQNNAFTGEIPMELTKSIVGLRFDRPDGGVAVGYLDIIQGKTVYMKVVEDSIGLRALDITPKTEINSLWKTDKVGAESNLASNISNAYVTFQAPYLYFETVKKEDFENWKTMIPLQKKAFDNMCAQSIDSVEITDSNLRHLIYNNLYVGYIGNYVLAYRKNAKETYDLTVEAYPYEYYSAFFSEVDLNENSFLDVPPMSYTPYYFTYQLVDRLPELNIKNDETISDWRTRVTPVIEQLKLAAGSEFYDFLVATCYVRNIRESKLLNDFQINQLKENVCEGLYEIVMNENSRQSSKKQ